MGEASSYTYQWNRDDTPVSGATRSTYVLGTADEGSTVTCTVTAANAAGLESATTLGTIDVGAGGGTGTVSFPLGIAIGSDNAMTEASDEGFAQYQIMAAHGFASVRVPAYYTSDHTVSNDGTIRAALRAGLDVLIILGGYHITVGSAAFASFCTSVVSTYAPLGCNHYEVLNEENYAINWDTSVNQTVSPSGYASLLKDSYAAVKAADSGATVIMGGLANVAASDGASLGSGNYSVSLTQTTFMTLVYAAMGGSSSGYFDAAAVHPYTFPDIPTGSGDNFGNALSPTGTSVRTIMVQNGDSEKKIWVTEFGAPTGTAAGIDNPVTEPDQSESYSEALEMCAGWSWVGAFYAFNWNDDADGDFGLTDATYVPKPALAVILTYMG
jgi:hypothetical protein